jgi:hypothetical protein
MGVAFSGFIFLVGVAGCGGGGGSAGTGGGGTGGSGITGGGVSAPATSVYVTQTTYSLPAPTSTNVLQFPRSGSGSVTPTATINGPSGVQFNLLTIDHSGSLYVAGNIYTAACNSPTSGGSEVLIYAPGATGKAAPARTITGSLTGFQSMCGPSINGIDVDSAGNLYVASYTVIGMPPNNIVYPAISVFSPTANGNAAPSKSIAGPSTTIVFPGQVAVDAAGTIYVANTPPTGPGSVLIFNSSATGNVAPTATLAGPNTTIYNIRGVAVDSSGNIYVASLAEAPAPNPALSGTPSILEFSPGSTGNVAPIRTISGSATTMGEIGNISIDSDGNIYVFGDPMPNTLLKFSSTATGNVAPASSISLSAFYQIGAGIAVQ